MIQLKNDSIRQAAQSNQSRYGAVNAYAQNAYKRLDDYASSAQSNLNDAYDRAVRAADAQTQAQIGTLNLQKRPAYDAYMSGRAAANQAYQKYGNYNGSFGSGMAEAGLSGSGYEQVVKARAFSQRQSQLAAANAQLQDQLTKVDAQIAQAKLSGDAKKAEYYTQRAQQLTALQEKISDSLDTISSQIYKMDTSERDYNYQLEQDAIRRAQQERQLALTAERNRLAQEEWDFKRKGYETQMEKYKKRIAELEAQLNPDTRIPDNAIRYYPRDQLAQKPGLGLDFSWATK